MTVCSVAGIAAAHAAFGDRIEDTSTAAIAEFYVDALGLCIGAVVGGAAVGLADTTGAGLVGAVVSAWCSAGAVGVVAAAILGGGALERLALGALVAVATVVLLCVGATAGAALRLVASGKSERRRRT